MVNYSLGFKFSSLGQRWKGRKEGVKAKRQLSYGLFLALALLVFALDQLSKFWIEQNMLPGETWPLITGLLNLTYIRNPGAAFGILAYQTSFFIVIKTIMILLLVYCAYLFSPEQVAIRLALAFLLGGVMGNLYDRLRTGYVIDFFDLRFWPVFNIADIALVAGVSLLILAIGRKGAVFRML